MLLVKALLVWGVIAVAEAVHGILRVALLNRRLGDKRARQISVVTGSLIILLIAWFTVPWINPPDTTACLLIGLLWVSLMLAFDLGLGRLYFRMSWKRLTADFDPRQGGWLGLGMLALLLAPLIVNLLRTNQV